MPIIVGRNTNAAVVVIAEKAFDMIRQSAPPQPKHGYYEAGNSAIDL